MNKLYRPFSQIQNPNAISNKPFFHFYQQGINLSLSNQLQQANQAFTSSLSQIQLSHESELQHYSYIIRRMAHNYRRLGQNQQAQEKLYQIIKHKRDRQVNNTLIYNDYDNLFKHMLSYDLRKAGLLAKALLTEQQKKDMPAYYIKLFKFNLANTYLLSGNYEDAKHKYYQMLDADPQGNLKSYAYNNLALACWWHKNPIHSTASAEHSSSKVEDDFNKTKDIFSISISNAEKVEEIEDDERLMKMKETLDSKNKQLHQSIQFNAKASLFPLSNLPEFYLSNDPIQKQTILYWFHKALKLSKKLQKQEVFDRLFIQIHILNHNTQILQQNLSALILKYRQVQQFSEQLFYCKTYGLLFNNPQSEEYRKRAQLLTHILPKWSQKHRHVAMDKLDLIN